jgi:hypothetical protein
LGNTDIHMNHPIQNPKDKNKFTSCFEWVWNLVSYLKGKTRIEGVEQFAEDSI